MTGVEKENAEHERKFLVRSEQWRDSIVSSRVIRQVYVSQDANLWVTRVRICDEEETALLTVKGPRKGVSNLEFEYRIPYEDGLQIWKESPGVRISKRRSIVVEEQGKWEVDEFLDAALDGLVMAEFEMPHPGFKVILPPWVGMDVSEDHEYRNEFLAASAARISIGKRPVP